MFIGDAALCNAAPSYPSFSTKSGFTIANPGRDYRRHDYSKKTSKTCFLSRLGEELAIDGIFGTGIGAWEMGLGATPAEKNDGKTELATGAGCFGLGVLCMKLGERYEAKHPDKRYHSSKNKSHFYKSKSGYTRYG